MKDKYNLSAEENLFLAKKVLVSNIYNSAKLEGLNITFPETQTILDGVNVSGVKLDDINCVLNMRDAWKEVLNNINEELSIDFICKINSFVSRNESLKWGVLRDGKVGISETNYIPDIPVYEIVEKEISNILKIEEVTLRAIKFMLYSMRKQLFWDGNKRTSTICANKIMIENGCGIIKVPDSKLKDFTILLSEYYTTNKNDKIKQFIYENCIDGIVFES